MNNTQRTDWYWIRHAPVQGQESRYYGRLDVAAEAVQPGVASALARHLPNEAVWVAGPLGRMRQTALSLKPGVDPISIADFDEQDMGRWQGRSHQDVYAESRHLDWSNPAELVPPHGESFADQADRVAGAIERLSAHYGGRSIVAVTHAGAIRAAIAYAMELDVAMALRIEVAPVSLTRLTHRLSDGVATWSVGTINLEVRV